MRTQLESAIQAIHVRYGSQALRRADALTAPTPWPTAVEAIDRLSGIGGLPAGRLSVLAGTGSCGKMSAALAILARATHDFAQTVVIDLGLGFDPWALLPHRPDLDTLTVVRPPSSEAAGEAATALARAGVGLLLTPPLPESWLNTLEAPAARSASVVLVLTDTPAPALAHASSLTFAFERMEWTWERGQPVGLRTAVSCVKNKVAVPGLAAELEVRYPVGPRLFAGQPLRTITTTEEERWQEREEARSAAG